MGAYYFCGENHDRKTAKSIRKLAVSLCRFKVPAVSFADDPLERPPVIQDRVTKVKLNNGEEMSQFGLGTCDRKANDGEVNRVRVVVMDAIDVWLPTFRLCMKPHI